MAGDIALTWQPLPGFADWSIAAGDLATGTDLESAMYVSLFSDRRLPTDTRPPSGQDRRGWWGDAYGKYWQPLGAVAVPLLGSRLWTLERAKKTSSTGLLRQAEGYAREALQWMIDNDVAASVVASASWFNRTALALRVVITEPDGTQRTFRFSRLWADVFATPGSASTTPAAPTAPVVITIGAAISDRSGSILSDRRGGLLLDQNGLGNLVEDDTNAPVLDDTGNAVTDS